MAKGALPTGWIKPSRWLPACGGVAATAAVALVLGFTKAKSPARAETPSIDAPVASHEWEVRNGRGKAFAARGEPALALAEFNQAISHNSGHAVLYANRGGTKLQLGDREGAVIDCSHAIRMDPRCVEALLNRAQARKELGNWAGAADDYSHALQFLKESDYLRQPVSVRLEEAREKARVKSN